MLLIWHRLYRKGYQTGYLLVKLNRRNEPMTKKTKKIGEIYVDAGLCWIGDPANFWPDEDRVSEPSAIREAGTWQQFCAKIDKTPYPHHYNFNGLGVVVTSGLGDGIYPVFAEIEDGTITSVTIKFLSDKG